MTFPIRGLENATKTLNSIKKTSDGIKLNQRNPFQTCHLQSLSFPPTDVLAITPSYFLLDMTPFRAEGSRRNSRFSHPPESAGVLQPQDGPTAAPSRRPVPQRFPQPPPGDTAPAGTGAASGGGKRSAPMHGVIAAAILKRGLWLRYSPQTVTLQRACNDLQLPQSYFRLSRPFAHRCCARPAAAGEVQGNAGAAGRAQPNSIVIFRTPKSDIPFSYFFFFSKCTFTLIFVTDNKPETTGDCARVKPQRSLEAALPPPESKRLPHTETAAFPAPPSGGRPEGGREPRGARPARPPPPPPPGRGRAGPPGNPAPGSARRAARSPQRAERGGTTGRDGTRTGRLHRAGSTPPVYRPCRRGR